MTSAPTAEPHSHRGAITVCVMLATILQALDMTIANVALPYMQSSLSTTQDRINVVLTSYIIAAAILMPATGWLAARLGRKTLFLLSVAGFTMSSGLCGLSLSLSQMVAFRFLQGLFGATLVPLSQAVLLDEYPRERHASAMALWGVGVMVGPILGPVLGGWLTEFYSWRWVFYINLPVGVLTLLGLSAYLRPTPPQPGLRFDWFGFLALALAIGSLQAMLDRGERLDWFASAEIQLEAGLVLLGGYLFVTHMLTTEHPFFDRRLFRDRNFVTGLAFIFIVGVILLATLALLAPFLQTILGYPVLLSGLLLAPRGIGTMAAMLLVGRLANRVDLRVIIVAGLSLTALALWEMTRFSLDVTFAMLIESGLLQGLGLGMIFVPLSTMSFATLPGDLRNAGTALFSLSRSLGSSLGISVVIYLLGQYAGRMHAHLAAFVSPFRAPVQELPALLRPDLPTGRVLLDGMVARQSAVIAYLSDFRLMLWVSLAALPMVFLLRRDVRHREAPKLAAISE